MESFLFLVIGVVGGRAVQALSLTVHNQVENAFGGINVSFLFTRLQIFSMDVESIKIITLCTR